MVWNSLFPRTLAWVLVFGLMASVQALSLASQSANDDPDTLPPGVYESSRHNFRVVTLAEGLENPWSIAWLPSGEMLVTERPGRLRIMRNGKLEPEPVSGCRASPCMFRCP